MKDDLASLKLAPRLDATDPDTEAVFAERWLSLVSSSSSDPDSRRIAFDLLEGAEPRLTDRIRAGLETPGRDLSGIATDDWLRNPPRVVLLAHLMDPFEAELTALLEAEVKAARSPESQSALIVPVLSTRGLTKLSTRLAKQLIQLAKGNSQAGLEARRILLDLPFPAGELESDLQAWTGGPSLPITQETVTPWILLLRLKGDIPEARWVDLVRRDDVNEVAAALKRNPKRLSQLPALQEAVREKLIEPQPVTLWFNLFSVVSEQMPEMAEHFFEARRQAPAAAFTLPIDAVFLSLADRRHDAWIADLSQPPPSSDCSRVRWRLAVLERVARVGRPVAPSLRDLWREAARCKADPFVAGPTDSELWDRVVAAAVPGESLEGLLLPLLAGNGPFPPPPAMRPAGVAALHGTALVDALVEGKEDRADYLLGIGVKPEGRRLSERGYWTGLLGTNPRPISRSDLFALQTLRPVPEAIWKQVELLAADEAADFEKRGRALIALASSGRGQRVREQLAERLNDEDAGIVRIASTLLAEALDKLPFTAQLPKLPEEVLVNFRLRPELADQARAFHQHLLRFSPKFGESFLAYSNGSESCLVLAARIPASTNVTRTLLIKAANGDSAASARQRLCLRLLGNEDDPAVILARAWVVPEEAQAASISGALRALWEDEETRASLKRELATRAARVAPLLPRTLGSQSDLEYWEKQLGSEFSQEARQIANERRKRAFYAAVVGIPLALLAHLGVWTLILTIYPRSSTVQSIILWNPWFRRILGFGYIDLVLLAWPFARRQLFSPFRELLLGDVLEQGESELDRRDYFGESLVRRRREGTGEYEEGKPILATLPQVRGRVLLIGRSGLGKSSFLRFLLTRSAIQRREVVVYLRADHCKVGVENAIGSRCMDLGNDQQLLRSMIHAGRMFVYIDGYNEVDTSTQDQITLFLSSFPRGNILVASQIPLRGLARLQTFEIQPLDQAAGRSFLLSRVKVLPEGSRVMAEVYERSASAFLDDYWANRQAGVLTAALDEAMANPMDLTTVSLLLAQARVPDLFSLEWQHFEMARERLAASGLEFRTEPFSKAVLDQRLSDREDLEQLDFKPEVAALIESKLAQVRTYADRSGRIVSQEARFRHDRVRDFFCHFAMSAVPAEEMAQLARDARLAGVFPFLARSLPAERAASIREHLIRMAAEVEDHRVSDAYVRELVRREQLQSGDPEWLDGFDSAEAARARERAFELLGERSTTDRELATVRQAIDRERRLTRILALSDAEQLLARAQEILKSLGAKPEVEGDGLRMRTPQEHPFALAAAASALPLQPYQCELAIARSSPGGHAVLLVVNSEADRDPAKRQVLSTASVPSGVAVVLAQELLALYISGSDATRNEFWRRVELNLTKERPHVS